jgi:hypothetical protein
MATDLKLTQLHDLLIENGDLVIARDLEETRQSFRIRIWFWKGEWPYDQNQGVPWFDYLFDVSTPKAEVDRIIRGVLLGTVGAREILEYKGWSDPEAKSGLVYHRTDTIWGEEIIERIAI